MLQFLKMILKKKKGYCIGAYNYSVPDIHHGILRGNKPSPYTRKERFLNSDPRMIHMVNFDPRVNFVLLKPGFVDTPVIPQNLEQVLEETAKRFIQLTTTIDPRLVLSPHFKVFDLDYGTESQLINFIKRFLSEDMSNQLEKEKVIVHYDGSKMF